MPRGDGIEMTAVWGKAGWAHPPMIPGWAFCFSCFRESRTWGVREYDERVWSGLVGAGTCLVSTSWREVRLGGWSARAGWLDIPPETEQNESDPDPSLPPSLE